MISRQNISIAITNLSQKLAKNAGLIFCLVFGVIAFSTTVKSHNSGLMGAYLVPNFPDATTGMSIIRLWTYVEKFEFGLTGDLFFSNYLPYGLLAGYLIYLICNRAIKNNTFKTLLLVLPGLLITLYFSAFAGPLYDITFAVSLAVCLLYLIDVGESITSKQILKLGFWVTLMYMSRPFGMYFAVVIYGYFFYKVGRRILPACLITLVVMVPFHVNQLNKFDTFTLSTYSGTNLIEALSSVGENPNQFTRCIVLLGRSGYDTKEMVDCSKINQAKAIEIYQTKPKVFLKIFSPKRLLKTFIFPDPYWHGLNMTVEQKKAMNFKVLLIIYYLSLFFAYLIVIFNFTKNKFYILPTVFFGMGLLFPAMGTDGSEAIRIFMPFIAIAYLAVTNRRGENILGWRI
jgi:hypothetical protein